MKRDQIDSLLDELEKEPDKPVTNAGLCGFVRRILQPKGVPRTDELTVAQNEEEKVPQSKVSEKPTPEQPDLYGQIENLQAECDVLSKQCFSWQQAYDRLEQRAKEAQSQVISYEEQISLLEHKLREEMQQIATLGARAEQAEAKQQHLEVSLTQHAEKITATENLLEEAEKKNAAYSIEVKQLQKTIVENKENAVRAAEELALAHQAECHQYEEKLLKNAQELHAQQEKLSAASLQEQQQAEQLEKLRTNIASAEKLMARLWPPCLDIPALQPFSELWKRELQTAAPSPSLLFMFANIFTWSCATAASNKDDSDNSIEVMATTGLYNFSRFLLEWLYAHGETADAAFGILCALADKLNDELANAGYEIEVPMLDSPFSSKSMSASSAGRASGCVAAVCAWSIKSSNSAIYKKKSIVTLN